MRKVYRNPKELGTCLKDVVDCYWNDLSSYETMEDKIAILVENNKERIYSNGFMYNKISNILGSSRVEIINTIVKDKGIEL